MPRDPGPPRGVLRTPTLGEGLREHERVAPRSAALAEHIAHFWWVRWELSAASVVETLPHPCVHLTVEARRAEVGGVATGAFRRRLGLRDRVFGVKFRPAAFAPWFDRPLSTITDRRIPATEIVPAAYVREIRAATSFAACCEIAERHLLAQLPPLPPATAAIRDLVERVARDPSLTRVEALCNLAQLDVRTLQRRFARLVGVSPKWVIERYRLHEAAALLARPAPPTVAEIAARLGYFDQAHFARAFKAVVGAAPSGYLAPRR